MSRKKNTCKELTLEEFYDEISLKDKNNKENQRYERCYKLTCESENHFDLQYHDGLNEDVLPFNPDGSCQPGGLYFFTESQLVNLYDYVNNVFYIREVIFYDPNTYEDLTDVRIYREKHKYKANKFYLLPRKEFNIIDHYYNEDDLLFFRDNINELKKYIDFNNHECAIRSLNNNESLIIELSKFINIDKYEYTRFVKKLVNNSRIYKNKEIVKDINPALMTRTSYYEVCILLNTQIYDYFECVNKDFLTKEQFFDLCLIGCQSALQNHYINYKYYDGNCDELIDLLNKYDLIELLKNHLEDDDYNNLLNRFLNN